MLRQEQNYMQRDIVSIMGTLKAAARRYAEFDFVTAQYVRDYSDPAAAIVGGEGMLIQFNHFPGNARMRFGRPVEPNKISLYYSLSETPDLQTLLHHINIDFATINISVRYPELKIRGVSIPENVLKVASPFSHTDSLSLKALSLCLDMNNGVFHVDKYVRIANAVISSTLRSKAKELREAGREAFALAEAPLIIWNNNIDRLEAPKLFPDAKPPKLRKPEAEPQSGLSMSSSSFGK